MLCSFALFPPTAANTIDYIMDTVNVHLKGENGFPNDYSNKYNKSENTWPFPHDNLMDWLA